MAEKPWKRELRQKIKTGVYGIAPHYDYPDAVPSGILIDDEKQRRMRKRNARRQR